MEQWTEEVELFCRGCGREANKSLVEELVKERFVEKTFDPSTGTMIYRLAKKGKERLLILEALKMIKAECEEADARGDNSIVSLILILFPAYYAFHYGIELEASHEEIEKAFVAAVKEVDPKKGLLELLKKVDENIVKGRKELKQIYR